MKANVPIWESPGGPSFPTLKGEVSADVCVVGLGGSGLTAIDEALDNGASVVGVEARTVAAGAAGRNGGLLLAGLAPFYHDAVRELGRERASALYRATIEEQSLISTATPTRVRRTDSLRIEDDAAGRADCDAQLAAMRADDLPVERHDGPEGVGLRFPGDLSFDPLGRCRDLAARVTIKGAKLFENSPTFEIEGDVVVTQHGTVRCKRVVVAIDGGLEVVLPELTGRVRTARLQMLGTAPSPGTKLPIPMYLRFGYDYAQQLADGRLAVGGCRDRFEASEWTRDHEPTDEVQACIERILRDRLDCDAPIVDRWAASVGYVDGPLPIVDEVHDGVIAIGGYNGTGNLVGALAGRAAASIAVGVPSRLRELLT